MRADDAITVVSGLPRSGTSMMMGMLRAGGLELCTDGARAADADNPRGYFELEAVKALARESGWLGAARGRALKVVSPLLRHLPDAYAYRVVLMERALADVVRSQRRMLARRGEPAADPDAAVCAAFEGHLRALDAWLRARPRIRLLRVDYDAAVDDPAACAARVEAFLERGLDVAAMARAVDPALRRSRAG